MQPRLQSRDYCNYCLLTLERPSLSFLLRISFKIRAGSCHRYSYSPPRHLFKLSFSSKPQPSHWRPQISTQRSTRRLRAECKPHHPPPIDQFLCAAESNDVGISYARRHLCPLYFLVFPSRLSLSAVNGPDINLK